MIPENTANPQNAHQRIHQLCSTRRLTPGCPATVASGWLPRWTSRATLRGIQNQPTGVNQLPMAQPRLYRRPCCGARISTLLRTRWNQMTKTMMEAMKTGKLRMVANAPTKVPGLAPLWSDPM